MIGFKKYALLVLRMFRGFRIIRNFRAIRAIRDFRFIRFIRAIRAFRSIQLIRAIRAIQAIRFFRLIRAIRLIPWPSSFTLVPVGALLAVFGFLPCRAAAMRSRDVFLFLGLGFHFAIISLGCLATLAKIDTMLKNSTEIVVVHLLMLGLINDGTGAHL